MGAAERARTIERISGGVRDDGDWPSRVRVMYRSME
jgi:hypothetical protein